MRELWGWTPWTAAELPPSSSRVFAPRFDVHETVGEFVFRADLPGIKQENLEITLTAKPTSHRRSARAAKQRRNRAQPPQRTRIRRLRARLHLPDSVDGEKIQATMNDGVLNLVVPKKPEAQPRQIPISVTVPKA